MYPYHNKIKQRIHNGEMEAYYYCKNYPGIGECLVLVFKTEPILRPIRPHKYHEYQDMLGEHKEEDGKKILNSKL